MTDHKRIIKDNCNQVVGIYVPQQDSVELDVSVRPVILEAKYYNPRERREIIRAGRNYSSSLLNHKIKEANNFMRD